ncbi:DUF927 domain-containing protein [Chromobacterium paludis]|uniref:DUF927 domain-containing protein n=1 Tax=Chromobacterium paludis TaxID=2605945 RepID=A0A5C1DKL6_9NEIS|nr:DUF927 domain-containing protein [Chromobacterium paludis]QEL56607.1 DUF927 domain-containing protein [Chromobacterium paludis]
MSKNDLEALQNALEADKFTLRPRYQVTHDAVQFIDVKRNAETGELTELPPVSLCDRLELIGRGEDETGRQYRILSWRSRGSGTPRRVAFPLRLAGEREGWAMLRDAGLAISSRRGLQERLAEYLQTDGDNTLHRVTERGGWQHGAYILPSGEVLGQSKQPVFYNGDLSSAEAYQAAGDVGSWRDNVARLAAGNSRCMLALGCAFAAPLASLVDLESGGFHLFGDSGDGKTTVARMAGSVWGHPDLQVLNWDATPLALANSAAARNDGLMVLDEVGQGSPDAVSMASYRLFNGIGKAQGAKEGGNRQMPRWRVLALSTGEHPLGQFLSGNGKRVKAGQETRLASIPADAGAGYGAFECLHEHDTPGQLAEAIKDATIAHHGTAGRAFIAHVAAHRCEIAARLREAMAAWRDALPAGAVGQARRIAARFAVLAVALELATECGLTGWAAGVGREAMRRISREWLAINGAGKHEDKAITRQAGHFLDTHGLARFIALPIAEELPRVPNLAGYRRYTTDGEPEYLVLPAVFDAEVIAGFDRDKACKALAAAGMLQCKPGHFTSKQRTPSHPKGGRYFLMLSVDLEAANEPGDELAG